MTNLLRQVAIEALRDEAARFSGHDAGDGTVYLPSIATLLWISVVDASENNVLSAEIFADHEDLPEPVMFIAVGSGDDFRESARLACEQWFGVVFPVLHSAFADHETLNVHVGKMTTTDGKGRQSTWQVLGGPVRVVVAGDGLAGTEPVQTAMLQALMDCIAGTAMSLLPFWIDGYAAIQDNGKVLSDCRLTNFPWQAGTEVLDGYGSRLSLDGYIFRSHRQFIFFRRTDVPRVKPVAVPPLKPALSPPAAPGKPWWRRIFRR